MERLYRIVFLGLFILGFIGAIASADREASKTDADQPVTSLLKDARLAQEVNAINSGRWTLDVNDSNEDGLARVESLLSPSLSKATDSPDNSTAE